MKSILKLLVNLDRYNISYTNIISKPLETATGSKIYLESNEPNKYMENPLVNRAYCG